VEKHRKGNTQTRFTKKEKGVKFFDHSKAFCPGIQNGGGVAGKSWSSMGGGESSILLEQGGGGGPGNKEKQGKARLKPTRRQKEAKRERGERVRSHEEPANYGGS